MPAAEKSNRRMDGQRAFAGSSTFDARIARFQKCAQVTRGRTIMRSLARNVLWSLSTVVVLTAWPEHDPLAETTGASTTVERFQAALIEAMRGGATLGFEGRRESLSPVIGEVFDLPSVSKLVLGKSWQTLDAADRDAIIDKLGRLAAVTLASRFDSYSGERFEIVEEKPLESGPPASYAASSTLAIALVRVDYALHERDGRWRILHAWYDGVSGSRIHREEFAAIIAREGTDGLMQQLEQKDRADNRAIRRLVQLVPRGSRSWSRGTRRTTLGPGDG